MSLCRMPNSVRWSVAKSASKRLRRFSAARGFNLIEMLLALAISAALLTATMVAMNASFHAYQQTAETSSMHTVSRLMMHRMLSLIRTGDEFGPFPQDPLVTVIESDYIEMINLSNQLIVLEWKEEDHALYLSVYDWDADANQGEGAWIETSHNMMLGGVIPQFDEGGERIKPFTLTFEKGKQLYRVTIDVAVLPDEGQHLEIEGNVEHGAIRLVASAIPRSRAY